MQLPLHTVRLIPKQKTDKKKTIHFRKSLGTLPNPFPKLQNSQGSNGSTGKSEEKSQLYWAKGTGFGTGSTQQSWNVEQALVRQRTEEEHVTVLLQV